MMQNIQKRWQSKQLPGIDCLTYGDGRVLLFNCYSMSESDKVQLFCFPLCDTTITSLEKYNDDIWTEVEYNKDIYFYYGLNKIVYGEGSMGNEGFVGLIDDKGLLLWAFFFGFSNPIVNVWVYDTTLVCLSTNDKKIEINLLDLSEVSITTVNF